MNTEKNSLYRLGKLDKFEVAKNNPDVRGWTVIDLNGERIGKVDEFIVDTEAQKVRYLDVELDKDVAQTTGKGHILVPIGMARLHKNDDNVLVERLDRATVQHYPAYDGGTVSREYENSLRQSLAFNENSSQHTTNTLFSTDNKIHDNKGISREHNHVSQADLDRMRAELEARRHNEEQLQSQHNRMNDHVQASSHEYQNSQEAYTEKYKGEMRSMEEQLKMAIAQRDIAIRERDIARAERDILRVERDNLQAGNGNKDKFYTDHYFDDSKFYENRKK